MLYGAKNGELQIGDRILYYVTFGRGTRPLVMIPGLGDGLHTVKGLALSFAWLYRRYANEYRVFLLSRPEPVREGETTADMAETAAEAMKALGLEKAYVLGVSQRGMIAQHLAARHPELVGKLVLAVTCPRSNDSVIAACGRWIEMAERGDYAALTIDTAETSYTPEYLARMRRMYPIAARVGKPKDYTRCIREARACQTQDAAAVLGELRCPTLVIGAEEDQVIGPQASRELAAAIPDAGLCLFPGYGHGVYDETEDFHRRVRAFFR